VSWRYVWAKLSETRREVMAQTDAGTSAPSTGLAERAGTFVKAFQEIYNRPSTQVMHLAGTAMCPTLNAHALKDSAAVDKLVVRLIQHPSSETIAVGDVVAFTNPKAKHQDEEQNLMVRRVAAMEGDVLNGDDSDDEDSSFMLPPGMCWVLADNEELEPPNVIDSRTIGPLPFENIRGRVIYQVNSAANHGMVQNNPSFSAEDMAVVETEVDVEQLLGDRQEDE
jgi:hypothetical protein